MEIIEIKYNVHFCRCGRIHFTKVKDLYNAAINGKEMLLICNRCGCTTRIGADANIDWSLMYKFDVENQILLSDNIFNIVASIGERVYMETGEEASAYVNSVFYDDCSRPPKGVPNKEFDMKRIVVDMKRTIDSIKDEEKLEAMSYCKIDALDWSNTKWERKA